MFYDAELQFLCKTFNKARISTAVVLSNLIQKDIFDENFKLLFFNNFIDENYLNNLKHNTIYRVDNNFGLRCIVFRLPDSASVLIIGPYLSQNYDPSKLLELAEKYSIAPQQLKLLENFYGNTPYLSENSHLFLMLDAFAENIWKANNFKIVDISNDTNQNATTTNVQATYSQEDTILNMKLMEERYAAENELMLAVPSGQPHKITRILDNFSNMPFEKRLDDPLRNLKNYGIIMNTLLRKAAEKGGVHPLYIDELSSKFAIKIEHVPSVNQIKSLMSEMYISYCEMVQQHSIKKYSTPVQKAILIIERNISSQLTLKNIAQNQNINPSYLSTIFKRETGKNITEYIIYKKMHFAAHLLKSTSLQIQTIASYCGILDVQYFSKLFKKHMNQTPTQYRKDNIINR